MVDPTITKFLATLAETQYLAPDRMQAYQRRLLEKILRHARSQTAFYADRLAPVFRADDSIDWDRWSEIPILTRAEAQANADALKAREVPPIAGPTHRSVTSGSTGHAFLHLSSHLHRIASACASERVYDWHKFDPSVLTAFIRAMPEKDAPYPEGSFSKGWRIAYPESPGAQLSIVTPIDQQIEWLRRVRPAILVTYPSILREIGKLTADGDPLRFQALMTTSEMTSPDTRAAIRTSFGIDPLDQYGSAEIGHIAATCPHSGLSHIASELVHVEIVDEDGVPLAPGREGRVIATSFYNLAMPFIRYDMGDYGRLAAEPCACGRTLPSLHQVLGRVRNVFRFVDGSRKWPRSLTQQQLIPNRQSQVVQVAVDRIAFRYVPQSPDQVNDIKGFTDLVKTVLHPSVEADLVAVDRIERSPSGKFEDYISLVN